MAQVLKYRNKLEIMRDILGLLSEPRKQTHVMYEAKLSYPQLKGYLAELREKGLMEESEGLLVLTNAGKRKLAILKEACA